MNQKKKEKKGVKIFSKFLTVIIVFLVIVCLILFFKLVTNSDVSIFGVRFYCVSTGSMYPTIKPYSLIVVKATDPDKLKEGDIISFISRDESIYGLTNTHRILEIIEENGSKAFVTMGDNNPVPDSNYVYPEDIVGKVVAHTPPIRGLTDFLEFAGSPTGFIVVIIFPLVFILMLIFRNFLLTLKENEELLEKEEEEAAAGSLKDVATAASAEEQKEAAIRILEMYFGKKLSEVTEKDIEEKLKELNGEATERSGKK